MYAVIKTGGKQYRVSAGDEFTVEKLVAEAGEKIQFNEVLMLGGDEVKVGAPLVDGAAVNAEVVEQTRGPKVMSFKKRRRKHGSKRLKGHRQHLTMVRITEILADAAKAAKPKAAAKAKAEAKPKAAAKPKAEAKTKAPAETATAKPGNLLDAPKGEADDLSKISGVGPKLVEKLNASGVFHFWQIAEWKAADITYMDDQLSFKGRIERDNWIEQAKDFAGEAK